MAPRTRRSQRSSETASVTKLLQCWTTRGCHWQVPRKHQAGTPRAASETSPTNPFGTGSSRRRSGGRTHRATWPARPASCGLCLVASDGVRRHLGLEERRVVSSGSLDQGLPAFSGLRYGVVFPEFSTHRCARVFEAVSQGRIHDGPLTVPMRLRRPRTQHQAGQTLRPKVRVPIYASGIQRLLHLRAVFKPQRSPLWRPSVPGCAQVAWHPAELADWMGTT